MKNILTKLLCIVIIVLACGTAVSSVQAKEIAAPIAKTNKTLSGSLSFVFPSLKASINDRIEADRINLIKNRDARNLLLQTRATSTNLTRLDNSASTTENIATLQKIAVTISNLENIRIRTLAHVDDADRSPKVSSEINASLDLANDAIRTASTTLSQLVDVLPTTSPTVFASTTENINFAISIAKESLGFALDRIKLSANN